MRIEDDLDRLYGLPPDEFVAARNEAAKAARTAGEPELADRLKRLRRPTAPVWVVNQLAHRHELDLQRLLKAGDAVRAAQLDTVAGGSAEAFAEARQRLQAARERLSRDVVEIVERNGLSSAVADRAMRALDAAAMLTGDRRELVEHGRLAEELEPPSFDDALAVLTAAGPPSTGSKGGRRRDSRNDASARRALDEARQRVRDLRTTKQKAGEAARATVARAAQAESEAARLRDESERAATEHAQTRKALAAAEQKLERLERTTARHRD